MKERGADLSKNSVGTDLLYLPINIAKRLLKTTNGK